MANTLHIVNGDSTAEILKKSNLSGDTIVWREMLCEGPVSKIVGNDEFWKKRYAYFENELSVSKLEYFDKTIKNLIQIEDLPMDVEVVLWFEFDLFCQVNLLAACNFLLQNFRKDLKYSLVCTGYVKEKDRLQSLSDFTIYEFPLLYENRIKLSKPNLQFASDCWEVYAENDIEKLDNFNFKNRKFMYLQEAIIQHLKRFPAENGLNEIQQKTLEIIKSKPLTENEIVKELLIWQQKETVYGFGDLQYLLTLKKLKNYYTIKDTEYFVTTEGEKLLTT